MLGSRARPLIGLFLALFMLLSVAGTGSASFHEGRVTFETTLGFTDAPAGNLTNLDPNDLDMNIGVFQLAESGTGTLEIDECAAPGSQRLNIYWVDDSFADQPPEPVRVNDAYVKFTTALTRTLSIQGGTGQASTAGPVATAPVHFELNVGWQGSVGIHWHDGWKAQATANSTLLPVDAPDLGVPLPGSPGLLDGSVTLTMPSDDGAAGIPSGGPLVFHLVVTCDDYADFTLEFGSASTMEYIWGEGDDRDTTGGGIPDRWAMFPDGTDWSYDEQVRYGTDPTDPEDHPGVQSTVCPGYTIEEAFEGGFDGQNPNTCPGAGGLPWLFLILALLLVVLLVGGAYGAVTTVNKKVRMSVSHDGFQDIKRGTSAQYELLLTAKGKEGEEVPVELSLKGVPEDWSASVDPAHATLTAGEEPEPVVATLTVTPPPEEEYEAEAVVTVTATPTDEDGKTSPMKPGTSVKTKTIVNIDMEPPEGEKRKKGFVPPGERLRSMMPKKQEEGEGAEAQEQDGHEEAAGPTEADTGEDGSKGKKGRGLGRLKRKKKGEGEPAQEEEGEAQESETGHASGVGAPAAEAATQGKPDLAVGKLAHDPADFSEGDTVTTTVPVKNKGTQPVQGLLLRLYVNDDRVDEKELDLDAGEASEVTFTWTAQPDENRVRVRGGLKEA